MMYIFQSTTVHLSPDERFECRLKVRGRPNVLVHVREVEEVQFTYPDTDQETERGLVAHGRWLTQSGEWSSIDAHPQITEGELPERVLTALLEAAGVLE